MLFSKLIHFLDNKSILGWIISQNSGYYPTKDKKVIGKLDRILIFEKIKKLSIAHGQGYTLQCVSRLHSMQYYTYMCQTFQLHIRTYIRSHECKQPLRPIIIANKTPSKQRKDCFFIGQILGTQAFQPPVAYTVVSPFLSAATCISTVS